MEDKFLFPPWCYDKLMRQINTPISFHRDVMVLHLPGDARTCSHHFWFHSLCISLMTTCEMMKHCNCNQLIEKTDFLRGNRHYKTLHPWCYDLSPSSGLQLSHWTCLFQLIVHNSHDTFRNDGILQLKPAQSTNWLHQRQWPPPHLCTMILWSYTIQGTKAIARIMFGSIYSAILSRSL